MASRLAAIVDLYSRFVVGWALSAVNDRQLVIRALKMASRRRCPEAGLMHHSDQGSPYASEDYQNVLGAHEITCSMSRRGNCYDNAVAESWFSTLKAELGERFEMSEERTARIVCRRGCVRGIQCGRIGGGRGAQEHRAPPVTARATTSIPCGAGEGPSALGSVVVMAELTYPGV